MSKTKIINCERCDGSGYIDDYSKICPKCDGAGSIEIDSEVLYRKLRAEQKFRKEKEK